MADVFISYSRKDKDFVLALHKALEKRGRDVWADWEDIPLTAKWKEEIYVGIESADAFAFVISPDSVASEYCKQELGHAVKNNKRLVPIVRRVVDDKYVPPDLASHQYVYFRESDDFQKAFESLIDALDTDLEQVHTHTRLLTRAKEWDKEGRDSSFLLRGKDLEAAEAWQVREAEKEPKLTPLQKEYILVSRQAATRRQRVTLGVVGFGLIVAVVLGLVALWQWIEANNQKNEANNQGNEANNQKTIALARQLAAQAEVARNQGGALLERSVLLAVESRRRIPSLEADQTLRSELPLLPYTVASLAHEGTVGEIAFSPDGKYLATTSSDKIARVWDAVDGSEVASPMAHEGDVVDVAFSPDGKYLATASSDKTARLWDAVSGREVARMTHENEVRHVAFSPDGKHLATASSDYTARVWDLISSSEVARMTHEKFVNRVSFSPDGKYLATASNDKTARVWAVGGKEIARILHEAAVNGVAFSPDGKYLATASDDKTARVQRWQPKGLFDEACTRLTRNLTREEWEQYVGDEPYQKTCPSLPGPEE